MSREREELFDMARSIIDGELGILVNGYDIDNTADALSYAILAAGWVKPRPVATIDELAKLPTDIISVSRTTGKPEARGPYGRMTYPQRSCTSRREASLPRVWSLPPSPAHSNHLPQPSSPEMPLPTKGKTRELGRPITEPGGQVRLPAPVVVASWN